MRRFILLDFMRWVLAMLVVAMHLNGYAAPHKAYLAVDFFFILSGFVLTGAYESRASTPNFFSSYLIDRIARLRMTARPYTAEMLAERWECSAETVRQMIRDGRLPAFRVGRMMRVTQRVVEQYECGIAALAGVETAIIRGDILGGQVPQFRQDVSSRLGQLRSLAALAHLGLVCGPDLRDGHARLWGAGLEDQVASFSLRFFERVSRKAITSPRSVCFVPHDDEAALEPSDPIRRGGWTARSAPSLGVSGQPFSWPRRAFRSRRSRSIWGIRTPILPGQHTLASRQTT